MNLRISRVYRSILRLKLNSKNRKLVKNKEVTIFSNNCVGGVIYSELGLKFHSPLINMFFYPKDYIKFLKNPKKYIYGEVLLKSQNQFNYLVVLIEDIEIHCVHFHSFEEIVQKWESRSKRINWDNIKVIMSERDGCTFDDLIEFDNLPYKDKVVFVHRNMPEIKSSIYIEDIDLNGEDGHMVKPLTDYLGKFTGKRIIDKWDYVKFINYGEIK